MNETNIWLSGLLRKENKNSIEEKEEFYYIITHFLFLFCLSVHAYLLQRGYPLEYWGLNQLSFPAVA